MNIESIQQIVEGFNLPDETTTDLTAALVRREENVLGNLAVIGERFGVMPHIFAKVVADNGLGAPKTAEEKEFISVQYDQANARLVKQQAELIAGLNQVPVEDVMERMDVQWPSTTVEDES